MAISRCDIIIILFIQPGPKCKIALFVKMSINWVTESLYLQYSLFPLETRRGNISDTTKN